MVVDHHPEQRRFVMQLGDGAAVLDYRLPSPKVMEMYHTFVPGTARGKGVAAALVSGALDYARANGFRIIPACSYVASFVDSHAEYNDVVAEDDENSPPRAAPACEI